MPESTHDWRYKPCLEPNIYQTRIKFTGLTTVDWTTIAILRSYKYWWFPADTGRLTKFPIVQDCSYPLNNGTNDNTNDRQLESYFIEHNIPA